MRSINGGAPLRNCVHSRPVSPNRPNLTVPIAIAACCPCRAQNLRVCPARDRRLHLVACFSRLGCPGLTMLMRRMCPLKVDRFCCRLWLSPMSASTRSNHARDGGPCRATACVVGKAACCWESMRRQHAEKACGESMRSVVCVADPKTWEQCVGADA